MPASAASVRDLDRHWLALNLPFLQNGSRGPLEGPAWSVVEGVRPVTLTAVHGVVHARPGAERKRTEANTGGLVLALAQRFACWAGVVRRSSSDDDANWSDEHPLKRALLDRGAVGSGHVLVGLDADDRRGHEGRHRGTEPLFVRAIGHVASVRSLSTIPPVAAQARPNEHRAAGPTGQPSARSKSRTQGDRESDQDETVAVSGARTLKTTVTSKASLSACLAPSARPSNLRLDARAKIRHWAASRCVARYGTSR